ncbi:thioredoxin family protein [Candidatus Woesearchaeota archaeon]|nr:thioredoxin family protein [Candidatus Woesearchaeota archaeon]|tara:strand:- start:13467 stop:14003 length:537 start_codon:yes stop_codon:yes gene_type:complete
MESENFKMQIGADAIPFNLPGVDGKTYSLDSFGKDLLVVVFTCNHCPYAIAYEKRLIELAKIFANAAFVAINANDSVNYPDDSFEKMKERAAEKGFPYPYLHDESQEIAAAYGALVTPHIFMFGKDRKLIYQGGIDNNWENESAATEHYLKDALHEATEGKEISKKTSPVIGCSVKWK